MSTTTDSTTQPAPAMPANQSAITDVVRGLNLSPEALRLAHWRKLPPLPVPDVPAFDLASAGERLLKARKVDYYSSDWSSAGLRWGMSVQEAAFWVVAAGRWCKGHESAQQVAVFTRKQTLPDAPDEEWVRAQFAERQRELPGELATAFATILGPLRLLEILTEGVFTATGQNVHSWYMRHDIPLYRGFWENVLPYLDPASLNPARDALRPKLDPNTWPKTGYDGFPRPYFVAALLGMSAEVEEVVRTWPVRGPKDTHTPWTITNNQPLLVLFGLSDPARIASVARNLQLGVTCPFELRGWLANTGTGGLDFAANTLQGRDAAWAGELSAEFCRIPDPVAAPHVLGLKVNGSFPATARRWLGRNVGSATAGLLETAAGRGKVADAAGEYLRDLVKTGYGWVVEREMAGADPEVAARVKRSVLEKPERTAEPLTPGTEPEWLAAALRTVSAVSCESTRHSLPEWLNPATLPPILIDSRRLPDETVALMLRQVRGTTAEDATSLAAKVAAGADAGTCDRFAAALFERWIAEKDTTKDSWVLTAAAVLGGDATVAVLVPRVKRWPGGTSSKRTREGLRAIRQIGTPYALAQIAAMAAGGGNYRTISAEELRETAKQRNITIEQLEDRTIPTLGLDDSSAEATLDFGPRQFRAIVAPDLRLLARDDHGKTHLVLPTPRKTDDRVKVAEARAAWKLAKKQFDLVMGGVCKRMEQALVSQRRWGFDEFAMHLVRHPITGAVVRRLLWGLFDPTTKQLTAAFRVTDEGEYVDADDRPLPPPAEGFTVGVLHPVQLPLAERATWAERLSDYEIVPPFPQLARPVIELTAEEREATEFTRFNRKDMHRYQVEALPAFVRWAREYPSFARRFPHLGLKAVARTNGYNPMELTGIVFRSDAVPARGQPELPPLALGTVDPIMLCECLADVQSWTAPTGT